MRQIANGFRITTVAACVFSDRQLMGARFVGSPGRREQRLGTMTAKYAPQGWARTARAYESIRDRGGIRMPQSTTTGATQKPSSGVNPLSMLLHLGKTFALTG